jgi:hypothetical protein
MRKKNYYTGGYTGSLDYSNSVLLGNKPFSSVFVGGSGSNTGNTNTAGGTADDKKNKGDFWKNLANVVGGLFGGGGNNQQQQTYVPQEAPKDKPNYGLIIGIIVAVIAVGVGIYFMTKK